jgi:hypothetical protein
VEVGKAVKRNLSAVVDRERKAIALANPLAKVEQTRWGYPWSLSGKAREMDPAVPVVFADVRFRRLPTLRLLERNVRRVSGVESEKLLQVGRGSVNPTEGVAYFENRFRKTVRKDGRWSPEAEGRGCS